MVKLTRERQNLKQKVQEDQDLIYNLEERLENLELNQYRPDTPDILRKLVSFFTRKEDKITLRTKITKSETKIIQRETKIIEQNEDSATSWIFRQAYDNV
jgi:hypothetical protein